MPKQSPTNSPAPHATDAHRTDQLMLESGTRRLSPRREETFSNSGIFKRVLQQKHLIQLIQHTLRQKLKLVVTKLHQQTSAATSLEWALLLAAIVLPGYWIITRGLGAIIGHYQLITTMLGLPVP